MDSVPRKKAKLLAAEYEKDLLATDIRFNNDAKVITCDGSIFEISNAFIVQLKDIEYIAVFAEHYDTLVFARDEVEFYANYYRLVVEDIQE